MLISELTAQLAASRAAHLDAVEDARHERERARHHVEQAEKLGAALADARLRLQEERKESALLRRTLENTDQNTYVGAALNSADANLRLVEEGQRLEAELSRKSRTEQVWRPLRMARLLRRLGTQHRRARHAGVRAGSCSFLLIWNPLPAGPPRSFCHAPDRAHGVPEASGHPPRRIPDSTGGGDAAAGGRAGVGHSRTGAVRVERG
eukprot:scaffold9250_cov105-Isochrysis_galbana.AAC.3